MKLKLTAPLYQGYNGQLGRYRFENGISVEHIPEIEMARIGANFGSVRIDDEGVEHGNPSPAHTVVLVQKLRLDTRRTLARQSEAEKVEEGLEIVIGSAERRTLLTREALEAIASKSGIAGLRLVAADWNVKSKSIPALLGMILDAQDKYCTRQRAAMQAKGIPDAEIDLILTAKNEAPETVERSVNPRSQKSADTAPAPASEEPAQDAAATGDLSAAISGTAE